MSLDLVASPILWDHCWGQRASEATGTLDPTSVTRRDAAYPGPCGSICTWVARLPLWRHIDMLACEILIPYLTSGPLFPKESRPMNWDLIAYV